MKLAERPEEEGRAELAHNRAVPVMAYGMAEKDSGLVGVIVAAMAATMSLNTREYRACGCPGPGWTEV
jgi:hypothetical protein